MMKKIILLSLCFIIFVIYLAPAKLIDNLIDGHSEIKINGISGSIWNGKVKQIQHKKIVINNVNYSINPLKFLIANFMLDLTIDDKDINGNVSMDLASVFSQELAISEADLQVDANFLDDKLPMNNLSLMGEISLLELDLETERKKLAHLNGQIKWKNAVINYAGQDWNLGDFAIQATTDPDSGAIVCEILETKNNLGLKGKVILDKSGFVDFTGSIATNIDQTLYASMALFNNGKPKNGRLPIKFKQKVF